MRDIFLILGRGSQTLLPATRGDDFEEKTRKIGGHVVIGKPKNAVAVQGKSMSAGKVVVVALFVSGTVEFDDEVCSDSEKVGDIGRNRDLSPELQSSAFPVSQCLL